MVSERNIVERVTSVVSSGMARTAAVSVWGASALGRTITIFVNSDDLRGDHRDMMKVGKEASEMVADILMEKDFIDSRPKMSEFKVKVDMRGPSVELMMSADLFEESNMDQFTMDLIADELEDKMGHRHKASMESRIAERVVAKMVSAKVTDVESVGRNVTLLVDVDDSDDGRREMDQISKKAIKVVGDVLKRNNFLDRPIKKSDIKVGVGRFGVSLDFSPEFMRDARLDTFLLDKVIVKGLAKAFK